MKILKEILTPLALLILSGTILYDHFTPHRNIPLSEARMPGVDGQSLGKAYAPVLVSTYADAWLAAARVVEDGQSIPEAERTLQETWKDARVKAFTEEVVPHFAAVLPEGTEPTSPGQRARVVALWRSFARGLKAGR